MTTKVVCALFCWILCGNAAFGQQNPISTRIVAADALFSTNLIFNGDAEAAIGSASGYDVYPAAGWITRGNFTVVQYGAGSARSPSE